MRRLLSLLAVCAVTIVAKPAPVNAGISFNLGNHPQPNEENVLLNGGAFGSLAIGETNQSHLPVGFWSTTDTLTEPSNGQSRIEAGDGKINNISVFIPGGYYEDIILNPFNGGREGDAAVKVLTDMGDYDYLFPSFGPGENFLTIFATGGEKILSTTVCSDGGFDDLRQVRISGPNMNNCPPVPEPCSLALLGGSVLPFMFRRRRA